MEKILIIEDSKLISNFLERSLKSSLDGFDIISIDSFQELKKFDLDNQNIVLSLVDIHLPDVHDLSLLNYLIKKDIPSIVMTATFEEKLYNEIKKHNIIDFVLKDSMDSMKYIVSLVKRIINNRDKKVLVVDDSQTSLTHLNNFLQTQLLTPILEKNSQNALEIIKNEDISVVITDYNMPKLNGIELIKEIRKHKNKEELGIIGISSDEKSAIHFLKFGANDFIKKPFLKEEFAHRVNNLQDHLENIQQLQNVVNTDYLTGVYNRRYFYANANKYYQEATSSKQNFAIAMLDIDNFKKVNDTYGHDIGDLAIKSIANTLKSLTKGKDIVARFGGEEFVVLLKDITLQDAIEVFEKIRLQISQNKIYIDDTNYITITVSIGLTSLEDNKDLNDLIKIADKRLYIAKNSGKNKVVYQEEAVCI